MNSPWRIELFGGLQLVRDGQVISRFQTRKTAALLAYLAYYRDKVVAREVLADLFWPDNDPEAARNSLRVALNSLRKQLEPPGVPVGGVLLADRAAVHLNPATFVTDVSDFENALRREKQADDDNGRTQALLRAVEVYRGPLLTGWYEEWIDLEQTRLAEAYGSALRRLTNLLFKAGEFDQAVDYARRAIHADPLREEAHRLLMRLYAAMGRPAAAKEQYQKLEKVLQEEMDAVPSTVTRELLKQITSEPGRMLGLEGTAAAPASVKGAPEAVPATPAAVVPRFVPVATEPATSGSTGGNTSGSGIPLQFTRFFGREREIAEIEHLLNVEGTRLVSLIGPGGTGKTRLSVEIANRYGTAHNGRAWVALMSELTDSAQVGPALLAALRLAPRPDTLPLDQLAEALGDVPALLILDNLEQITEPGAEWARLLLERLPALRLLITSRQRLGLPEEREVLLSPLPVPESAITALESDFSTVLSASPATPEVLQTLVACPSVALFLDRARAVRPDFQITPRNAAAIASLCRRLDGLPLALELSSAWVRLLSPAQMLERLTERYDLLTSDRRENATTRQRSLRAVMDESFRLMPEDLRPFFASLSVFRGSWNLDAAQAICGEPDALEMTDLLQQRSLLTIRPAVESSAHRDDSGGGDSGVRFYLLEMVRHYADTILSPEERDALHGAHREYYAGLAERAGEALSGPNAEDWRDLLEADHDNIRAALLSALSEEPAQALSMVASLWRFWYARGHVEEGQRFVERALRSVEESTPLPLLALALHGAGRLALSLGNASLAGVRFAGAALTLTQGDAPLYLRTMVATDQAIAARARGDRAAERDAYETLTLLHRQAGDRWAEARAWESLGDVLDATGDADGAGRCRREAEELGSGGSEPSIATALLDLGDVAVAQGDYSAALPLLHEALEGYRREADEAGTARVLERIAVAALRQGDWAAARSTAEEALLLTAGNDGAFVGSILREAVAHETAAQ